MVRRAWVEKYKLPPAHDLWVGQPFAVHLQEFFEDKWVQKNELEEQLKDMDVDPIRRAHILESLGILTKLLETDEEQEARGAFQLTGDPVMDALEVAESLGEELDMDITVEEAKEYLEAHANERRQN